MKALLLKEFLKEKPLFSESLIHFFLIAITIIVFSPVRNHSFVNYDDNKFIYDNPHIQNGLTWEAIEWAFSADLIFNSPNADFWIPLTFLSHILTVEFFGMDASGHHLINLLLHVLNTVLLFGILKRITGALWPSAMVATLFAVHPLHVESVAWVTERKDVLSTFFWFLTMGAYLWYTKHPTTYRYLLVAFTLSMGLMAKPMLMTLPFVLLLLDYWPLRRFQLHNLRAFGRLVWEKTPLFILVASSILITFLAVKGGGHVSSLESYPLWTRIGNGVVSYVSYMGKMFWPSGLAVLYPQPEEALPVWKVSGAGLLIAVISIQAFRWIHQFPYVMIGWLWYLGTLIPTIGLVHAGLQAMADRYTYVPFIGLFIIIVWGVRDLSYQWAAQKVLLGMMAGITISILMGCTWIQVQHWKNSITLFEHTLKVTEKNYIAHTHLASAYETQGQIREASDHYLKAIHVKANYIPPYLNLGRIKEMAGELEAAKGFYQIVVKGNPNSYQAHFNLANVYIKQGLMDLAKEALEYTLQLHPNFSQAYNNLGFIYHSRNNLGDAHQSFRKAVLYDPNNAEAHQNLGIVLKQKGEYKDAERELLKAIQINPELVQAHRSIGFLYLEDLNNKEKGLFHLYQVKDLLSERDAEVEEAIERIQALSK